MSTREERIDSIRGDLEQMSLRAVKARERRQARLNALAGDMTKEYWESEVKDLACALWKGHERIARIERKGDCFIATVFKPVETSLGVFTVLVEAYEAVEAHFMLN